MTTMTTERRAWIGSLAAYNAGRLVGAWVDLDGLDAEDATEAAKAAMRPMIAGWMSEAEAFDEIHVFDHEGLGLIRGECSVSEAVAAAETLAELDEHEIAPFLAYVANGCGDDVDSFRDDFAGDWSSVEDYAADYLDSAGVLDKMPEHLRPYFDTQAYARDLVLGGDIWTDEHASGVYIFHN